MSDDDLVRQLRCYADIDDAVYNPWVYGEAADRIEKLEAALQFYVCGCNVRCADFKKNSRCGYTARKAREGKDG